MTIDLPKPSAHSGSRPQAQKMLDGLPHDLSRVEVTMDCNELAISTPSFWDEIVREVLATRSAQSLSVVGASARAAELAKKAAANRGLTDRLTIMPRAS